MFLAIDVGNTNTVFTVLGNKNYHGLWLKTSQLVQGREDESVVCTFRIHTIREREVDEYMAMISALLKGAGVSEEKISAIGISCVVKPILRKIALFIEKYFKRKPFILSWQNQKMLDLSMLHDPQTLGVDLISAALASIKLYNEPCIIIDCGTATTVSIILNSNGVWRYEGTVIMLGVNSTSKATSSLISALSGINVSYKNTPLYGKNTSEAISSGLYHGHIGALQYIVTNIKRNLLQEICRKHLTIVTGGMASTLLTNMDFVDIYNPYLVEFGIKFSYEIQHQENLSL